MSYVRSMAFRSVLTLLLIFHLVHCIKCRWEKGSVEVMNPRRAVTRPHVLSAAHSNLDVLCSLSLSLCSCDLCQLKNRDSTQCRLCAPLSSRRTQLTASPPSVPHMSRSASLEHPPLTLPSIGYSLATMLTCTLTWTGPGGATRSVQSRSKQ